MNNLEFERHLLQTETGVTPHYKHDSLCPTYYISNKEVDLRDYEIRFDETSLSLYQVRGWSDKLRDRLKEEYKTVIAITWHKDLVCQVLSKDKIYETA